MSQLDREQDTQEAPEDTEGYSRALASAGWVLLGVAAAVAVPLGRTNGASQAVRVIALLALVSGLVAALRERSARWGAVALLGAAAAVVVMVTR